MAPYSLFAVILDYPVQPIAGTVEDCLAKLALECPDAKAHLAVFQNAIVDMSPGQLQETYINAFDLRPDCTVNLGYHLFGDDGRRGLFLAELISRLETAGIATGSELPDHIGLLLRYMQHDQEECRVLIEDCMLPAVSRMVDILEATGNQYQHALRALLSVFQHQLDTSEAALETKV